MINKFLKYLCITLLISTMTIFSKTKIDLSKSALGISSQKATGLNVLAIMVEFETDTLDYTTGDGTFNSGYEYPDTLLLDAVEHNAEYFTDQLTYVKNYFYAMSGDTIVKNITVLDTVFTLNHPIWYYNQNYTDENLEEKLYEFYQDSWRKLSNDHSIPFSNYDTFVIFHAGSGQEFSAGYDDTPFDIPSVYFSLSDLNEKEVVLYDSINDKNVKVDNCIILPECEWQISNDKWYYAGMGGISTLMFAHHLGIPNLYSSENGQSCIGKFGLMDQGSANFSGMIPSSVCAWVKEQQGWTTIEDLTVSRDSIAVDSNSTIYRIPINTDEYFLVENRTPVHYTNSDSTIFGYDRDGKRIRFTIRKYGLEEYEIVDEGFKTLVSIQDNDYDFPLTYGFDLEDGDPLSVRTGGILVWHIDKRKTTPENIVNNAVNDDHDNRGVYLEEGDGSFDIGQDYWLFDAGYGTELGWYFDFFFGSNEMWLEYSNKDLNSVEFSNKSYPRSDTNEGTDTGIRLFNFSGISRSMRFSYELENQLSGYPINSGLENSNYMPFYYNDELYHLFYRNDGEIRIQKEDSLIFSDNTGVALSEKFEPVDYKDNLVLVQADSLGLTTINMNAPVIINTPVSKVTGQIKPGVIPTEEGLHIWTDVLSWNVETEIKNITDVAVTYDGSKDAYFIAAIKDRLLYIDQGLGIFIPYNNDNITGNSKVSIIGKSYDAIEDVIIVEDTNIIRYNMFHLLENNFQEAIKYLDFNGSTSLNDLDEDGNIDYLIANEGTIEVYNEHGYMENGFPLDTRVDQIDNIFTYETDDGKFCTFVDNAMNCGSYSFDGGYVRTENFTLGSDINNIGLLQSNGQVCIYSYDKLGTLNVYPLNEGTIDSYLQLQNGFILLSPEDASTTSNITNKKSVYNWPNPVKGDLTHFRFFLNEPGTVNITIYDLNGNKIKELSETFTESGDNFEIEWDVSGKPTGIYTAVLEFVAGSKTEKYKVKVAVIK
ncbi:MAG: T9SS type A sorting domain-containing protein [Candidatus Delongbacteria bacterium]|nr:T9SS type A sorting domain-containing protein [Candidatus Delongbacteria bacterium]